MDPPQDFKSLQEKIQASLVATTRSANVLANEDLAFQRTANPTAGARLDATNERLLRLAGDVLKSAGKFAGQAAPSLDDADDVDISWRGIVDVVDSLLEKADTCLDEYTGLIKRKNVPTAESGPTPKKSKPDRLEWSMRRANIVKPQNAFERKADNFHTGPWKPLLTTKPHAIVPLEQSLALTTVEGNETEYLHPYKTEIQAAKYPARVYKKAEPIKYLPVETTSATWVDTYDQVLEMLAELKKSTEIAVDLEHHDFRSYVGLLSLMQISTRDRDWIVDTLQPWRHKLEILNEVFADPNIVKVFHGAYMDMVWLQRDLGLYVVNLFDTHFASDVLGYSGKSLAYLLKRFADFDADKKYQMADWRIRPLPEEMLYYARSDTHYLLYIYDMVRNELLEHPNPGQNSMDFVEKNSKEVSLQTYETPICDGETGYGTRGWFNPLTRSPSLGSEPFSVYKAVFKWRDDMARTHDESPAFVMTNATVLEIARIMPGDPKALLSLLPRDAQIARSHLDELLALIGDAKARGINGPSFSDFCRGLPEGGMMKEASAKRGVQKAKKQAAIPDTKELRSQRSQLWGPVPLSSVWDGSNAASKTATETSNIAIPWTVYVQNQSAADVVMTDGDEQTSNGQAEAAEPSLPSEAAATMDEGFTLKSGKKRNIEEAMSDGDSSSDSDSSGGVELSANDMRRVSLEDTKPDVGALSKKQQKQQQKLEKRRIKQELRVAKRKEAKAQKAAMKAARKAEKGAAAGQQGAADASEEAEDQPFDYAQAQSVLHAQRADSRQEEAPKKLFDPYAAKTGDAPKGARNMNYQKPGKSATFKN